MTSIPPVRHSLWTIGAAVLIGAICNLIMSTLPVYLTVLAHYRALSEAQSGVIALADMGGIALGTSLCALMPKVVVRLTWRRAAVLGLAILLVANLLSIAVTSYVPFLIVRLVGGMGAGIAAAIVFAVLAEGDAARQLGMLYTLQMLSGFAAVPVLKPLAARFGLAGIFLAIAGIVVLGLLAAALFFPRESIREEAAEEHHAHAREKVTFNGWLSVLSVFVFFCGSGGVYAYLAYMGVAWGLPEASVDTGVSLSLLAAAAGSATTAVIGSRFGYFRPLLLGFAGLLGAMALLLGFKPTVLFIPVVMLFGYAWNIVTSYQFEAVTIIDPSSSAAMLVNAGTLGGLAIGPAIVGATASRDFRLGNGLCLAMCVAALALLLLALARHGALAKRQV